ncbi:dethiobiotin synthase [Thalassotalea fusca]
MKRLFITATDTDAGKTHFAQALVYKLTQTGNKVAVFKPVSAGCELVNGELINEDAKLLMDIANAEQSYNSINPIAFEQPIAPHIAAQQQGVSIEVNDLIKHYQQLVAKNADVIVTEGAGGWRLPLGNSRYLSELAQETHQAVILVVNMKLGCLNHALLTAEAIQRDGLSICGWFANIQHDMPYLEDNIEQLRTLLACPFIGRTMFEPDIKKVADQINTSVIL